ncbi:MAG: transposase [Nitrosopumilus sp.]|nr:transposase [Nitrosopumilus sp.]
MQFQEISDSQWKIIQKHIPKPARTGRPRCDDRVTINGIMFVLVTGCRWREMPEKYGSKSTAHLRLQKWQQRGTWKNILSGIIKSAHKQNKINLQKISVDSSTIPAKKVVM